MFFKLVSQDRLSPKYIPNYTFAATEFDLYAICCDLNDWSRVVCHLNEIECTKHKYREIRPLDLITPCKSFPSKNGSDMSIWIISFYYKTMIFKFKWKPFFNTNDFIELSKDLALLLFIFEEPLLLWNSQKDTEKNVLRIKVPTLNLTSIRQ